MSLPTITVEAAFGIINPGDFVVGTSLVGGADVITSGFNEITSSAELVTIRRGRWSQVTDVIDAGDMTVQVLNLDRRFDPTYTLSPYYGRVRPGVGIRVRATAPTFSAKSLMTGQADELGFEYDVSGRSVTIFRGTDALGQLGAAEFDDWTNTATSAPNKLLAICSRPEVAFPTTKTSFGAGVEALQSDSVSWGSNVLNYMQLIARSEIGYLWADADNTLTFRNRTVPGTVASSATFGTGGIAYQSIAAKYGEFLFSRVGVDREGGTTQTAQVSNLTTWQAANGSPRTLKLGGLLLASDAQSLALANYLLTQYSTPTWQVSEVGVELAPLSNADTNTMLSLDIGSVVTVVFTPNDIAPAITQKCLVQGVQHEITPGSHRITLSLIAAPVALFVVGTSLVGGTDVVGF
jgi:hypothetical protein